MFELRCDNDSDRRIINGFDTPKPNECWTIHTGCVFALSIICCRLLFVPQPPVTTHEAHAEVKAVLSVFSRRKGNSLTPPPNPSISTAFHKSLMQLILEYCFRNQDIWCKFDDHRGATLVCKRQMHILLPIDNSTGAQVSDSQD
jgi:hypothetical protein